MKYFVEYKFFYTFMQSITIRLFMKTNFEITVFTLR